MTSGQIASEFRHTMKDKARRRTSGVNLSLKLRVMGTIKQFNSSDEVEKISYTIKNTCLVGENSNFAL